MAELPPPGPPDLEAAVSRPPDPPPPGRPWLRVALLASGSAAAALLLLAGLQRGAAAIYGRLKPDLERQLGTVLGHPLQLGAFQGLGWSGLELGPSRLLPLPADPSSLRIARIGLSLDPISTLRRGLPVLRVSLDGVRLDLRRNPRGGYWQLGRLRPGQPQPRLDLRLRLLQPAVVAKPPHLLKRRLNSTSSSPLFRPTRKSPPLRPCVPSSPVSASLMPKLSWKALPSPSSKASPRTKQTPPKRLWKKPAPLSRSSNPRPLRSNYLLDNTGVLLPSHF